MFNTLSIKHISPLKIKLYDQKWLHMKCWCIVCILSTSLFHTVYWHMHCTVTCLTEQYRQTINRLESSGSLYKVWQRALWRDEGAGAARDAKMSLSHWMTMAIFFVVFTWSKLSCFFHRHTCPKKRNSAAGVLVFWVGEEVGWGREGRRRAGGGRGGKGGPLASECVTWQQKHTDTGYRFVEVQIKLPLNTQLSCSMRKCTMLPVSRQ